MMLTSYKLYKSDLLNHARKTTMESDVLFAHTSCPHELTIPNPSQPVA